MTRQLLVDRVQRDGWTFAATAAVFGVSPQTVSKWVRRHAMGGPHTLEDRSSRPHRSPTITAPALVTTIQQLRTAHGLPAWLIGQALGLPRSTVSAWIRRLALPRLRSAVLPVHRYEWARLGDMLHLDIKPLGCIGRIGHSHPWRSPRPHTRHRLGVRPRRGG